jgi:hypothetical protein
MLHWIIFRAKTRIAADGNDYDDLLTEFVFYYENEVHWRKYYTVEVIVMLFIAGYKGKI